jgi:hypothetical protein
MAEATKDGLTKFSDRILKTYVHNRSLCTNDISDAQHTSISFVIPSFSGNYRYNIMEYCTSVWKRGKVAISCMMQHLQGIFNLWKVRYSSTPTQQPVIVTCLQSMQSLPNVLV